MCVAPWVGAVMVSGYGAGFWAVILCPLDPWPGWACWLPGVIGPAVGAAQRRGRVVRMVGCAAGPGQALARAGPVGAASALSVVPVIWAWSSSEGSCPGWRPAMTAPMTAATGSSSGSELTQVAVLPVSVL